AAVAARVRLLREYGWRQRYVSEAVGMNSRLDELQAAVCSVKLRHLDDENADRARLAALYTRLLEPAPLVLPSVRREATHVWHQYVVRCRDRDALRQHLQAAGIGTLVHYPVPVHRQPAYAGRIACASSGLEESDRAAREVLSLPMHAQLGEAAVQRVATAVLAGPHGSA
ncbi:MAG: DegT/DnrJ/EryC1/StrS family aminotransferase, partial [Candidatus Binatia bacterium]